MRLLNVNSSLGLRTGGGTAERTFQMSRFLAKQDGVQCTVLTLDIELDARRIEALAPATLVALPCCWKRFYVPRRGWREIRRLVDEADAIHLMGHWSVLNLLVYLAARRGNKPYAVCPAGALPIFGRSATLKRIYNFIAGFAMIRNAAAWVAVTAAEFPHFEDYGIPRSRVAVIPNGVAEEDFPPTDRKAFLDRHRLPDVPLILFMGRLNPIKGPDLLLRAFCEAKDAFPDVHLVFAGPDGGMLETLKQIAHAGGAAERVHFLGYIAGRDKASAYHAAALLVIPSRQEAMSIVALEAGISGTPVLLTDQCGFDVIAERGGSVVPASANGIKSGLIEMLSAPANLKARGELLRDFVRTQYLWESVVQSYLVLYERMTGKHAR